jgi:hypothetical protein
MNILGLFCSLTFLCCSTRNCLPPQDQPGYGLAQLRERSSRESEPGYGLHVLRRSPREAVYAGASWELEHADEIATLPNRQPSPWISDRKDAGEVESIEAKIERLKKWQSEEF